jgi:hypothetical protein
MLKFRREAAFLFSGTKICNRDKDKEQGARSLPAEMPAGISNYEHTLGAA